MPIQVEVLGVKNIGCFQGEHKLELETSEGTDIVKGRGATGKTTLVSAIRFCVSGQLEGEFQSNYPMTKYLCPDIRETEEVFESYVWLIIYDTDKNQRYRLERSVQTSMTRWGPNHAVDALQVQTQSEDGWSESSVIQALNKLFPVPALLFSIRDSATPIGNKNWGNVGLYELINRLGDAAAQQAAARDIDLPEFYASEESLRNELIQRMNDTLSQINNRYTVEHGKGGLVGVNKDNSDRPVISLSTGQTHLLSHVAALVTGEMMPVSPPLIGDILYSQMDYEYQNDVHKLLQEADGHALLFLTEAELDGLNTDSQATLTNQNSHCRIESSN